MRRQPVMDVAELQDFLDEVFPQQKGRMAVQALGPMTAQVRCPVAHENLRPGGTVSGPTMFTLADYGFYAGVLAMIGREALTVTTNLNINFLRKPPVADLVADVRILRLGKTLATGDVAIHSDGVEGPVAHATVTYAIPPAR